MILLLALTAFLGFRAGAASEGRASALPVASVQKQSSTSTFAEQHRDSLRQQLLKPPTEEEAPFWFSAVVPEPAQPRLPSAAIVPLRPSPPDVAMRTAARVHELEASPATPDNIQHLNENVVVWYDQDPVQATEWLNTTGRFDELAPSLASIAATLGERGHLTIAHEIIENISDETTRRRAVLDVYSLQARNGLVSRESLASAGWSPEDINLVFQGD